MTMSRGIDNNREACSRLNGRDRVLKEPSGVDCVDDDAIHLDNQDEKNKIVLICDEMLDVKSKRNTDVITYSLFIGVEFDRSSTSQSMTIVSFFIDSITLKSNNFSANFSRISCDCSVNQVRLASCEDKG